MVLKVFSSILLISETVTYNYIIRQLGKNVKPFHSDPCKKNLLTFINK